MNGHEVILVAVDANKEITDYALEFAVRNVIKAGDSLILLALLPTQASHSSSINNRHPPLFQNYFSNFLKKWSLGHSERSEERARSIEHNALQKIENVCGRMMHQLCSKYNVPQVETEVKVVASARPGTVSVEAWQLKATWIILDRRLKIESESCLTQLRCNVVLIDHAIPKLLRAVNLTGIARKKREIHGDQIGLKSADLYGNLTGEVADDYNSQTTQSSLAALETNQSASSSSSAQEEQSHISVPRHKQTYSYTCKEMETQAVFPPSSTASKSQPLSKISNFYIGDLHQKPMTNHSERKTKGSNHSTPRKDVNVAPIPARRSTSSLQTLRKTGVLNQLISQKYSLLNPENEGMTSLYSQKIDRISNFRKAISISIKNPPTPPPLCSVCKHKAPVVGRVPRRFSYKEVERATNGFSNEKFLAKGGYGYVYKGVLPDGELVAVKQHKVMSAQGASEFCSDIEVLSCAQHRNLVMLVGYCIETEWFLIYEFACNGSLDNHLYGETKEVMAWKDRMKVAIGAARGLRYLHEDCRVGCIVHRDFRPKNILLTHDFEPMVGDFGLARWQADGQEAEETRVIGSFGYLAPEYTDSGLITEKADVYSFGVVLLELLCGLKAASFPRSIKQQFSVKGEGHPMLKKKLIHELIDPRLEQNFVEKELELMRFSASLCTSQNPEERPRISKVLRILEGDMPSEMAYGFMQPTRNHLENYSNVYHLEQLMIQRRDDTIHSLQQKAAGQKLRPHRHSVHTTNISRHSSFKSLANSIQHEEETVSGEYQAHLHGSLANFIQNR